MKPQLPALFMSVCMLFYAATSAQNIAFMQGNWYGRAYLPGVADQSYQLILEVDKVKGDRFEGVLKTIRPSDTSIHFDTRVLGMLSGKHFDMIRTKVIYVKSPKETKWQVSCTNCKPPKWSFTIDGDQVLIRGEVKKCSKDCDWVSEFSKPLLAFDETEKTAVYALAGKELQNKTVAAVAMKQQDAPIAQNQPANTQTIEIAQRLPLLPAGEIIVVKNSMPAAVTENTNTVFAKSAPSYSIKETVTATKRIIMPATGGIVKRNNGSGSYIYKRTTHTMGRGMASYYVSRAPLNIPVAKRAPPAESVVKESNSIIALPAALPADYAARKKNIIRAVVVNTDSVTVRVYDNGIVDGDIVSVIYNDHLVIDKLSLTARILEIKLPVTKKGINNLVFHAHNLGELPPNTAKLEILYGNKKEELTVASDLTVSSAIDIRYKEQ